MTFRQWLVLLARSPLLPALGAAIAAAINLTWSSALFGAAVGLVATALLTLATAGPRAPRRQTARTVAGLVVAMFAAVWVATHR